VLRSGLIYEFNKARAKVIGFTDEAVSWREDGKKTVRQTPRWFFEQHAVPLSMEDADARRA